MREITYLISLIKTRDAFLGMLCSLCSAVFSILLLATSAYLIASAAYRPPLYTLSAVITLVRAAGLLRAVFRYLERIISHRAAFKIEEQLRLDYFDLAIKILPIKEKFLGKTSQTEKFIDGIIRGTEYLRDFFVRTLAPPVTAFTLGLLTSLALFPVIGIPSFLILLLVFLHIVAGLKEKSAAKEAGAAYRRLVLDMAEGKEFLIFAGGVNFVLPKLRKYAEKFTDAANLNRLSVVKLNFFMELLRNIVFVILVILLMESYDKNMINAVWLSVYFILLTAIFEEFAGIPAAYAKGKSAIEYAKDLTSRNNAVVSDKTSSEENNIRSDKLLEARNISFAYNSYVFKDLSFDLKMGERLAIVGESGAGKTTLAACLLGLYGINSGSIMLNGADYKNLSNEEIRAHFAPLLQRAEIFSGSVGDNFRYLHKGITDEEINAALKKVKLSFDVNKKIEPNCKNLSGGEKIRLSLAFALASPAPILLLDEPTMSLDRRTGEEIMENILNTETRSVIVITHDENLASRMDKILSLS